MGIVTLLSIIGVICTGLAGLIKLLMAMKKDGSPRVGEEGFVEGIKNIFKFWN